MSLDYEEIERELKECSVSYIPALLKVIITRCRLEPIFKGWMGMQSFISRAYKLAGKK